VSGAGGGARRAGMRSKQVSGAERGVQWKKAAATSPDGCPWPSIIHKVVRRTPNLFELSEIDRNLCQN
jgi:hypothetical protein